MIPPMTPPRPDPAPRAARLAHPVPARRRRPLPVPSSCARAGRPTEPQGLPAHADEPPIPGSAPEDGTEQVPRPRGEDGGPSAQPMLARANSGRPYRSYTMPLTRSFTAVMSEGLYSGTIALCAAFHCCTSR